ncbi:MAG: FMN-binding protein [Methyloprofundus sp.]|nr:FMN-binding protein [Methyloprofundus sp.]
MLKSFLLVIVFSLPMIATAERYQSSEEFINETFVDAPPKPKLLWLKKPIKQSSKVILGHSPGFLRTRYWQQDKKSAWILEEIGKTKPITIGVIINNGKIEQIKVLAFRESRGWEVKHTFFTDQFKQLSLDSELNLDQPVDGIAGATLSVGALTRIARLALYFDQQIQ